MTNGERAVALIQSIVDDDLDAGSLFFAPDAEWVELPLGTVYRGPAGWRTNVEYWQTAFTDGYVEVTNVVDGGDQVVLEYTGGGVNTGTLSTPAGPIAPNGEHLVAQFVDVWEFRDGLIVGGRSYVGGLTALMNRPA